MQLEGEDFLLISRSIGSFPLYALQLALSASLLHFHCNIFSGLSLLWSCIV